MNLSGIVTMILGAMYVGAMAMVVFLIMVQLQSRKRMPRTFASLLRVKLGVLGLSWDFWAKSVSELQLEVEQIQLDAIGDGCSDRWRVCRWPDSTEQAVTWLMGIFISLALRGRRWRRRNEMRFSPLARGCSSSTSRWEGTIWDKNPALPGVGSSFGAKLKQIHIQWKLYRSGEGLGLSCAVIIKEKNINTGARPDDKHLLVKYGHNHWCYLCIRGATVEALASQLQKGVFRRRSWIAHPSSLSVVARNYIWTDAVFTRVRGLPTMANLQSEDGLLGPLTSVLCYSNGMYSMETTPPP